MFSRTNSRIAPLDIALNRVATGARSLMSSAVIASLLVCFALCAAPTQAQPNGTGPWPISSQDQQGIAAGTFEQIVGSIESDPRFARAKAVLLVRHGTLVGERYFGGTSIDDLHDLRSVTKSVLSMTLGIAIRRGDLPSVNAKVTDLLPAYADQLVGRPQANLDLEHLLTMQAGLEWHDDRQPWLDQIFVAPDLVRYLFDQRSVTAPGTEFAYSTAVSQVLAKVLTEATGTPLPDYVRQRLFAPLGIDRVEWLRRPSGDHYGGLGMAIAPRSMIRLGQLALQRGFWTDRQVVDEAWMNRSIRDARGGPFGYGYHWWRLGPERFTAIGYGGQYVDIDRGMDTVLALVSEWNVAADQQISLASFDDLRTLLENGLRAEAPSTVDLILPETADEQASSIPEVTVVEPEAGGNQILRLALLRTGDDGALAVRARTRRGSARPGRDFGGSSSTLRWESGEDGVREVNIAIFGDSLDEGDEDFFVDIDRLTGNGTVTMPTLRVQIHEGNDLPRFEWTEDSITLSEGETQVAILRRSAAGPPESVTLELRAISASPSDFGLVAPESTSESIVEMTASFGQGDVEAEVALATVPDEALEGIEFAQLRVPASEGQPAADLDIVLLDSAPTCEASSPDCFLQGRYLAAAHWWNESLSVGGRAIFAEIPGVSSAPGAESAQASFFSTDNVEVLLKMVDGTAINNSAWTFVAKSSDLPVWITILDQTTGRAARWATEPGRLCGIADTAAFQPESAAAGSTQMLIVDRLSGARSGSPAAPPDGAGIAPRLEAADPDCPDDAVCLQDRFEVSAIFRVGSTEKPAVPVPTGDPSGAFWFFSPSNVEIAVKILDGRAVNGHYWFFSGALTDLPYRIDVLDRETGEITAFENDRGDLCGFADIGTL